MKQSFIARVTERPRHIMLGAAGLSLVWFVILPMALVNGIAAVTYETVTRKRWPWTP